MGFEADENGEEQQSSAPPRLPLFSLPLPTMKSPEHNVWIGTPPHHTASIPFRWEEEPGKPRPCKALSLPSTTASNTLFKSLELPPRLLCEANFNKTPSPTTVLKGLNVSKSIFHSFRLSRGRDIGSFDSRRGCGESGGSSPERGLLGTLVLSKRGLLKKEREGRGRRGFLGLWEKRAFSWKQRTEEKVDSDGGSFVFSSIFSGEGTAFAGCDDDSESGGERGEMRRITGKTSFLGLTKARSRFWATIHGTVKQVIPCRTKATEWKKKDCNPSD